MRVILLFLILFLFTFCSNEKLDGLWYGVIKDRYERNPVLIKFEKGYFIDYFSVDSDTTKYRYFGNKIYFRNFRNKKETLKISMKDHKLSIFDTKSDTLIVELKRVTKNNFVFDFLNDQTLIIDLPSGNGLKKVLGKTHRFENPLYLTYKDGDLTANFLDSTLIVDDFYYKYLRNKTKSLEMDLFNWKKYRISLIADKKIKISDLDLLKKQLKIAGFTSIDYFLKSNFYDRLNILSLKLMELSEDDMKKYEVEKDTLSIPLPPRIPSILSLQDNLLLVEFTNGVLKINDNTFTQIDFRNLIDSRIESDTILGVFYHFDQKSNYQDFININDQVINSIYDVRDRYLIEKYGIKFREDHRFKNDEIRDSQLKFPLIMGQLDMKEYEEIKNSL